MTTTTSQTAQDRDLPAPADADEALQLVEEYCLKRATATRLAQEASPDIRERAGRLDLEARMLLDRIRATIGAELAALARVRAVATKWDAEFDGYSGGGAMLDDFLDALKGPAAGTEASNR